MDGGGDRPEKPKAPVAGPKKRRNVSKKAAAKKKKPIAQPKEQAEGAAQDASYFLDAEAELSGDDAGSEVVEPEKPGEFDDFLAPPEEEELPPEKRESRKVRYRQKSRILDLAVVFATLLKLD